MQILASLMRRQNGKEKMAVSTPKTQLPNPPSTIAIPQTSLALTIQLNLYYPFYSQSFAHLNYA